MTSKIFTLIVTTLIVALASFTISHAQETRTTSPPPATPTPPPIFRRHASEEIHAASAPLVRSTEAQVGVFSAATTAPQETAAPGDGDNPDNQIIPAPMLLSYRDVKDSFGKRIADSYIVVQVNIKNPDIEHQYLLQDLRVVFDPNQCEKAQEYYSRFDTSACQAQYEKYLKYPIAYSPVAQPALQAVAMVGENHNPRNIGFRLLDFAATMGGALTGFDFVGRDGKAALSVFNGTFLTASKTFIPDMTAGQLTRLTEQSYKPNTLVESKDTKNYDVFIPANQLFSKDNWKLYKQTVGNGSEESVQMLRLLQLVLTATASGTHIRNVEGENPLPVTGGGAPTSNPTP